MQDNAIIKSINAEGLSGDNSAQRVAANIINNLSNMSSSNISGTSDTTLAETQNVTDLGLYLVLMLVGIPLFIIQYFRRDPGFAKFLTQTTYKRRVKNPYVGLSDQDIDAVASNTSRNLTSLSATYGILLSFVVASKIEFAFHSWAFYVWAGLILSIVVRSLLMANRLSDIAHLSGITYQQKIANLLSSKGFLKHSALIFIAIIAFTPAFTLVNLEDKTIEKKYSYLGNYLILTVAISVVAVTLFFLYVATLIPESVHIFYLWIASALMLVTLFLTNSPLDLIHVKFFSDSNVFVLPSIIIPVVIFGYVFSSIFISMVALRYAYLFYDRRKASKNKSA